MIVDTHCHLYWRSFDEDRPQVLQRAREAGVARMVVVGTDLETSRAAADLCRSEPGLHPTAGLHPHDAARSDVATRAAIEELCRARACVAVGETGLDFFKQFSPREQQLAAFRWQLELALELGKPVVVHCREAHAETARMIGEHAGVRGVMHCYTMGPRELEPYLEAGLYISFSGVVTFPSNQQNREAARTVPEDRLLVETDCPFLAPQGYRGRRNEPAWARHVLECVAEARGDDFEVLAQRTSRNAEDLFGLAR